MTTRIVLALLATSLFGCGSNETIVTGTVTVNNQPLRHGYVTFFPVESTKGAKGAAIIDGHYALKKIDPGKWKALVSGTPEVQSIQNRNTPPTLKITPPTISPRVKGNQSIVEIREGKQKLDFALQ